MMDRANLAQEMQDMISTPTSPSMIQVLASMAYLYRHWPELPLSHDKGSTAVATPLTEEEAIRWVQGMKNADGSNGQHWTMAQTEEVRIQHHIECEPIQFWVTMNMVYSDYCKVAEKFNVSNLDFYAGMAKAFLDDKDAQPNKLARYREYVAG